RGGTAGHATSVRERSAVHPGGRQRPGGRPGRGPAGAPGLRGGRGGLRPDPRPEREGRDGAAAHRRAGRRLPVGRAGRRGRAADGFPVSAHTTEPHTEGPRTAGAPDGGPADTTRTGGELGPLVLSRGEVDRSGVLRANEGWLAQVWASPETRV